MEWAFIVAPIATLLGVALGLWGSHYLTVKREAKKSARELESLLDSLTTEIETVFAFYQQGIGKELDELADGATYEKYYLAKQDYFTVFSSSANQIGKIADDSLRTAILRAYTVAKALLDTWDWHNHLMHLQHEINLDRGVAQAQRTDIAKSILEHTATLKKYDSEAKLAAGAALKALRERKRAA